MELDDLEGRLKALEDDKAQSSFVDKYGAKFSNDKDIGVAILNELNRRGVDVSAADDAVQEILDQIRAEATALLDKINQSQAQVSDLMDKVNDVDAAVQAASGAPLPEDMPPDATGALPEALPPEETSPAAEAPAPEAPPAPVPEEAMGAAPAETAAPEAPAQEEPPAPDTTLSDERIKSIKSKVAAKRGAKPSAGWKPSKGILDSLRGGL